MSEMRELVRSLALNDKITIFISSHMLVEVQHICNRIGILQDGTLRAEGRVDQLLAGRAEPQRIIEIGGPDPTAVKAALIDRPGIEVIGHGEGGRTRVVLVNEEPAALLASLVTAGVRIDAFVPEHRSLEDVFLEVTR